MTENSNIEIRNSKQIQIIKWKKFPNKLVWDFGFECLVCFGFRSFDFAQDMHSDFD